MTIKILKYELRYCGFCKKELKFQMKIYKTNVEGLKEVEYCVFCESCEKKRMILEDKVKKYNKKLLDINFSKYLLYEKLLRQ